MITAIVLYDLPPHIDKECCRKHFHAIAPSFLEVPGLIRKQFIHATEGGYAGGSYLWESRAAAEAFSIVVPASCSRLPSARIRSSARR